jgi:hypothetical protein
MSILNYRFHLFAHWTGSPGAAKYFAVENLYSHALARFNEGKLRGHRIMAFKGLG